MVAAVKERCGSQSFCILAHLSSTSDGNIMIWYSWSFHAVAFILKHAYVCCTGCWVVKRASTDGVAARPCAYKALVVYIDGMDVDVCRVVTAEKPARSLPRTHGHIDILHTSHQHALVVAFVVRSCSILGHLPWCFSCQIACLRKMLTMRCCFVSYRAHPTCFEAAHQIHEHYTHFTYHCWCICIPQ